MISLDTNVVVRILVEDDVRQTERAKQLVVDLGRRDEKGHVAEVVFCELVWVLESCYELGRREIVEALRKLTGARQLLIDRSDAVLSALAAYEEGRGDFADYLIREIAKAAGCSAVATFDRKLLSEDLFTSP